MTGKTKNDIRLIDLGLPSGTLWADRNVGADVPEGYGDYFRFGETTPFTEDSQSYKFYDITADIAGKDRDAATVILGEQFCMPTLEQIKELVTECSRQWNTIGGVNGVMVTGPNGNSVFMPASGLRGYRDGSLLGVGSFGFYWSASPCGCNIGHNLYLGSSKWYWYNYYRAYGFPVRAVKR